MVAESGAGARVRLWGRSLGGRPPEGPRPEAGWGGPGGAWCTGAQPSNKGPPPAPRAGVCHQHRKPAELLPKANSTRNHHVSELTRGHVGIGDQPAPQQSSVWEELV